MPLENRAGELRTAIFVSSLRIPHRDGLAWVMIWVMGEVLEVALYALRQSGANYYPLFLELESEFKKAEKADALIQDGTNIYRFGDNFSTYARLALEKVTPEERSLFEKAVRQAVKALGSHRSSSRAIEELERARTRQ